MVYNLAQSYGTGAIQLIDWKSVEQAGAGSQQLKQLIIDTAVELGKLQEGEVTTGTFGSTLQKKWADRDTMNFNITAGTIARTAVLLLALTNQLLSAMGKSPLPIESATVEQLVTAGITTIAALIAWWKNNSFTKEAIAADAEYDRLRKRNGK